MPEPDHRLVPVPSAQLALAGNHLALLNKILPPAVHGPVSGRPWEIAHLGLKLVWIEPGTFLMGRWLSDDDDVYYRGPATRVTISRGYWLAATQLTQMQWEVMTGNNPSKFKQAGKDAPVEELSWNDAMAFCKMLTAQERAAGRLSEKEEYALPTEAQWEYACRAGTTGYHAWDIEAMAWYDENSDYTTHPVGTKKPNAWGLYDMHGNVSEFCLDSPGPASGKMGKYRIHRGGSCRDSAAEFRSESGSSFPSNRCTLI